MGGKGEAKAVLNRVYEKVKDKLKEGDRDLLDKGVYLWEVYAGWARYRLVNMGYLRSDSPKGIWELSDEGWKYLRELKRRPGKYSFSFN